MSRSGILISLILTVPALAQQQATHGPIEDFTGGVAVFLGNNKAGGAIRTYDDRDGSLVAAPPELAVVRLLPLDFNGRSQMDAFLADRPQFRADVPGATRLALPGRLGSLYRYRRTGFDGETLYGFLRVSHRGRLFRLLEREGWGIEGSEDPYLSTLAFSPDARSILVATCVEAGGDLIEADLVERTEFLRTPNLPPLTLSPRSLSLLASFGVATSQRAVLRFPRTREGVASAVMNPDGTSPPWISGEVVTSRNAEWAAVSAGVAEDRVLVHVFGAAGPFRCPNAEEGPMLGAGFLPEAPTGPFMAVSDDGQTTAWTCEVPTAEGTLTKECFVANLPPKTAAPPEHVTRDELFLDTLDEVGVVGFVTPDQLVFAVGERQKAPLSGLERFELFTASLDSAGNAQMGALTQANGDSQAPFFDDPALKPEEHTFWVPEGNGFLIYDGEGDRILSARLDSPGISVILGNVKGFDLAYSVGDEVVVSVRRSGEPEPWEIHRISKGLTFPSMLVLLGTQTTEYTTPIANEATREFGFVTAVGGVDIALSRVELDNGQVSSLLGMQPPYGPTLAIAPHGGLAFAAGKQYGVWPRGAPAPVYLRIPRTPGFILPGR